MRTSHSALTSAKPSEQTKDNSLLLPSPIEALILELLSDYKGSLFGLEMVKKSSGRLKRGTIYVTLHRMEQKGLVASETEPRINPEIGIPRRKYWITGLGERALYAYQAAHTAFQLKPALAGG